MKKIPYLDCAKGINSYSLFYLLSELAGGKRKIRKFREKHAVRSFLDVKGIIQKTKFEKAIKSQALQFFLLLAKAEAKVHKTTLQKVHLHEVSRIGNIYRVLHIFSLLKKLKIKKFICSTINLGRGVVKTSHGMLDIPTPATRELLKGLRTFQKGRGELTTPSGACFARILCKGFNSI